jgi:hypothetical protein
MRRHVYAWLVATIAAVFPTVTVAGEAEDQRIADHINQRLITDKDRGALSDFELDLYVENGQVWFKGVVASEEQEKLVFEAAQSARHLGVTKVYDMIEVRSARPTNDTSVQRVSTTEESGVLASSRRAAAPGPVGSGFVPQPGPAAPQPMYPPGYAPRPSMPLAAAPAGFGGQDPGVQYMPASSPAAIGARHDQPQMPNYAWPGYAAHPNYGALTYPQQYSPTAWPYIGPFYPYPQVPLGWRKVSMEWKDGWWFLDFQDR